MDSAIPGPATDLSATGRGEAPPAMAPRGDARDEERATWHFDTPALIPFPARAGSVLPPRTEPGPPPAARRVILLADDDESVRRLCERVLAACGHAVLSVPDGFEALEEARDSGPLDLLVTDILMPGCDGRELAGKLREDDPSLPVLYISGYSREAILGEGVDDAVTGFLAKPFNTDALLEQVHLLLARRDRILGRPAV